MRLESKLAKGSDIFGTAGGLWFLVLNDIPPPEVPNNSKVTATLYDRGGKTRTFETTINISINTGFDVVGRPIPREVAIIVPEDVRVEDLSRVEIEIPTN